MHPSSGNKKVVLLSIATITDSIGVKRTAITHEHEVIGFSRSVTTGEYYNQTSVTKIKDFKILIQSFLYGNEKYALIDNEIYKIERTYLNGHISNLYTELIKSNVHELNPHI